MNVAELIERRFGMVTKAVSNPLVNEAQTAITRVLANNPNRLGWTILNLSANNVFVALDQGVSADHGILLAPNGGNASMRYEEDFEATCWAVWAVAAANNSDIFCLEVIIAKSTEGGVLA